MQIRVKSADLLQRRQGTVRHRTVPGRAPADVFIYRRRTAPVRYVTMQEKILKTRPVPGRLSNSPVMCTPLKSYDVSFICDHSIILDADFSLFYSFYYFDTEVVKCVVCTWLLEEVSIKYLISWTNALLVQVVLMVNCCILHGTIMNAYIEEAMWTLYKILFTDSILNLYWVWDKDSASTSCAGKCHLTPPM